MANTWAQQAGAYFKQQRKTRPDLSFGDALKELSNLKNKGQMPAFSANKSKSRKSKRGKTHRRKTSRR